MVESYQETNEMSHKLSKNNVGRPSSFTTEHESYIRELLDKDPQFFSENIIGELSRVCGLFYFQNTTYSSLEEQCACDD